MSLVYHGSYLAVPKPSSNVGRRNLDFGKGFYLTRLMDQATKWATLVASRRPNAFGVVSVYEFDETALYDGHFKYKVFESYNIEWLDFVVSCRQGKDNSDYDIIEGGVANDQVIDTVEDYENGRITAEQALNQLRYKKPNNQICIRNQNTIDKHLKFTNSKTTTE